MQRRKLGKKDVALILILLAVSVGGWFMMTAALSPGEIPPEEHVPHGEVYFMGNVIKLVPLNVDQTFSVPERPGVVFEVRDGAIAFVESNCPDQVCVHAGFLNSPWHFAACLPNLLLLSVQFEDDLPHAAGNGIDTAVG